MGKRKTYSDVVDKSIEKAKSEEEAKNKAIYLTEANNAKAIEDLVLQQYHEARKVVGDRLKLKKSHSTYYGFSFQSKDKNYRCYIYAHNNYGLRSKFGITEISGQVGCNNADIELEVLSIKLKNWVRINLEKEGIL